MMAAGTNVTFNAAAPASPRATRKRACMTPACETISARPSGGSRCATAAITGATRAQNVLERLAPFGDVGARRLFRRMCEARRSRDDLIPAQPLPVSEAHLAQARFALHSYPRGRADRGGGFPCPREIRGQREIEALVCEVRRQGLRLRAALFVERDIRVSLEAPLAVPSRASMPHANQFLDAAVVLRRTKPGRTAYFWAGIGLPS